MITLTILAGLLVAVIGGWMLVEIQQGRRARWLALALPVLLAWPIGLHAYGSRLLGYATAEPLTDEFELIASYADEQAHVVYATVRLKGEQAPRLYAVTGEFESQRKSFASAQAQIGKGMPMRGQKRQGLRDDGEYVFYELPPSGVPEK